MWPNLTWSCCTSIEGNIRFGLLQVLIDLVHGRFALPFVLLGGYELWIIFDSPQPSSEELLQANSAVSTLLRQTVAQVIAAGNPSKLRSSTLEIFSHMKNGIKSSLAVSAKDSFNLSYDFLSKFHLVGIRWSSKSSTMNFAPQKTGTKIPIFTFKNCLNLGIVGSKELYDEVSKFGQTSPFRASGPLIKVMMPPVESPLSRLA